MPWSVRTAPLPDGDRPADLWIDADGCLATGPVLAAPSAVLIDGVRVR